MTEFDKLQLTHAVFKELYESLDTNRTLAKRHKINDFLGFGFKKDDLLLHPLIDRWEYPHRQTHGRFCFWVREKFHPFVSHARSIGERLFINGLLQELYEATNRFLSEVDRVDNGIAYVTVLEIKASVVLFVAAVLARSDVGDDYKKSYLAYWYQIASDISKRLESDIDSKTSSTLIAATRDLQYLVETSRNQ